MDPKALQELASAYKNMYAEAKDESPEKEEEDRKEDDDLAGSPNAKKNGKKKAKRWWDDDGDGKGYEKGEVKEDQDKGYVVTAADKKGNTKAWQGYKAGAKKKDGSPLYTAADHLKTEGVVKKELKSLHKAGNTLSPNAAAKADDQAGVGSRKGLPEETLVEKQKDTPLQVAAVIDKDRAKKATDDATYDRLHGKNKKADEDERYSKWERYKMKRDAQRAGHPWEHAKGSTTEKEGKKSEKAKRVYDPEHNKEETLWDVVADALTELHEVGGVQFKVVPIDEKAEKDWIQGAVKRPGAFTKKAKAHDMSVQGFASYVDKNPKKFDTRTKRQANLAQTFAKMRKEDMDIESMISNLELEGVTPEGAKHILANWVDDKGIPNNFGLGKAKMYEAQSSYDKARKAAARRAADRNAARRRGEMGGRMERETYTSEAGTRMHYKGYTARDGE